MAGLARHLRFPQLHFQDVTFAALATRRKLTDRNERHSKLLPSDAYYKILQRFETTITARR
jgi:hypothetical protein